MTQKNYNQLVNAGVDCFTSGNHIWDKKEIFNYIDNADKLVRPLNYPEGTKGEGFRIFDVKKHKICVMNFLGRVFMQPMDSQWKIIEEKIKEIKELSIDNCGERYIILTKKISQTPPKYPRISAKISKQPL